MPGRMNVGGWLGNSLELHCCQSRMKSGAPTESEHPELRLKSLQAIYMCVVNRDSDSLLKQCKQHRRFQLGEATRSNIYTVIDRDGAERRHRLRRREFQLKSLNSSQLFPDTSDT